MANDDKNKGPEEPTDLESGERRDPEIQEPLNEVSDAVEAVQEGKTIEEAEAEDPTAKRLDQFLKELESEKENPTALERVRKITKALLFVSRFVDVKTDKILLKEKPGNQAAEAFERHIEMDPVYFNNKQISEERLTKFKHVLLHELLHMERDIDNEGLVELASSKFTEDKVRDYEHLVNNVLQVTSVIGEYWHDGDKDAGVVEVLDLYSEENYDELFDKFKKAYEHKYGDKTARNPEIAEKVFAIAFPELQQVGTDRGVKWQVDEEGVDDSFGDVALGLGTMTPRMSPEPVEEDDGL